MRLSERNRCRTLTVCLCLVMAMFLLAGRAGSDTTLLGWDVAGEDLWSIDTAVPIRSIFVGGGNSGFASEIEFRNGVVYGTDTGDNTNFSMIDPSTGIVFNTITLTFPPEGNVLTSLEFVGDTLYAGLTIEGSQGTEPTYLSTVDLGTGVVTVVGAAGITSPFGGLAYDRSGAMMYAISAGGSTATLYTIDLITGAATAVASVLVGGLPFKATALEFGGDGVLYTAPSFNDPLFGHLLTIDSMTGAAIDLGLTGLVQGPVALTFAGVIFEDGFESGDTSVWSEVVP